MWEVHNKFIYSECKEPMNNLQRLYLLLEVEKVRQNHKRIPTTFIYPIGSLSLSCVTYMEDSRIIYNAYKNTVESCWIIKPLNKLFAKEFFYKSTCLYDTLFSFNKFIQATACKDVEYETEIWKSEKGLEESMSAMREYKIE